MLAEGRRGRCLTATCSTTPAVEPMKPKKKKKKIPGQSASLLCQLFPLFLAYFFDFLATTLHESYAMLLWSHASYVVVYEPSFLELRAKTLVE